MNSVAPLFYPFYHFFENNRASHLIQFRSADLFTTILSFSTNSSFNNNNKDIVGSESGGVCEGYVLFVPPLMRVLDEELLR